MGTSLSGLTPATTFDGLLKTSDNDGLTTTKKTIGTGDGINSQLKIATNSTQIGNIEFVSSNVIGTVSPSTNLRIVSGGIAVNGDYSNPTANTRLHIKGSGATSATTSLLVQNSAGTNVIKANDDGRVLLGAGTSYQNHLLELNGQGLGSAQTLLRLQSSVNFNGAYTGIGFTNSTNGASKSSEIRSYRESYGNAMTFNFSGTEMLRATSDGNLGIGETTPTARLHVKAETTQDTIARFQDPLNASTYIDIKNDSVLTDYVGLFWGSKAKIRSKEVGPIFFDVSQAVVFADGNAAKTKIYADGSMSIGTSTIPSSTMAYIKGSGATSATTALLVQNSAGTEHLKVTDDGEVNVRQSLYVNHSSVSSRSLRLGWGSIYATDNSSELILGAVYSQTTAPRIHLGGKTRASGADAIQVQTLNGMYIATTAYNEDPSAQLQVKGSGNDATTTALLVQNSDTTPLDLFKILDDGTLVAPNLPTSATGLPTGAIYNDAGTLKIV